jgi:hypothetical protein
MGAFFYAYFSPETKKKFPSLFVLVSSAFGLT